ncbi:FitA-like ribbon-helix-helix domain-containing protein [Helcobacillus massiliensis]|uniref:FitA-like ribbon-helix-helix domain-containing protein n=1 Tax=Helcobacillus massiliensis TaxID=521392 RepID=UPI0039EF7647
MSTLYIRDVPPDVSAVLKKRAALSGQSLSAYVVDELTAVAARPSKDELMARLDSISRSSAPTRDEILSELHKCRP